MSNKDKKYVDNFIKRNIAVSRAAEGQAARISANVDAMHKEIMAEVRRRYPNLTGRNITKLNKKIANIIERDYDGKIIPDINDVVETFIEREGSWLQRTLRIAPAAESFRVLNSAKIADAASKKTYQGHTFSFWFKKAGNNMHKKSVGILEAAYIAGATTDETVQNLSGFLNKSKSDIRTLARSYFNHASIESRTQHLDENADIIEEYIWVSVLDHRTTPFICGIRDGLRYGPDYEPIGHSLPWEEGPGRMHFNCRSTYIPKIKGQGDIRKYTQRPAISAGKNYESGLNKTKRGKVRKPTKPNRDKGIFDVRQVKATTDYESWLRTNKTSFISDIIGNKSLAKEFKQGKISLLDIVKRGDATDIDKL